MAIKTHIVGIDIDGKIYKVRKLSFGTQRGMIELQKNLNAKRKKMLEQYGSEDNIPEEEQVEIASLNFTLLDLLAEQFVDPKESKILDQLDSDNLVEFIQSLQ